MEREAERQRHLNSLTSSGWRRGTRSLHGLHARWAPDSGETVIFSRILVAPSIKHASRSLTARDRQANFCAAAAIRQSFVRRVSSSLRTYASDARDQFALFYFIARKQTLRLWQF